MSFSAICKCDSFRFSSDLLCDVETALCIVSLLLFMGHFGIIVYSGFCPRLASRRSCGQSANLISRNFLCFFALLNSRCMQRSGRKAESEE